MEWTEARPLHTKAGRALVEELVREPDRIEETVRSAMLGVNCSHMKVPLEVLLRGLAAVAVVSDAVRGERHYTDSVPLPQLESVRKGCSSLGLLGQALETVTGVAVAVAIWQAEEDRLAPDGFAEVVGELDTRLSQVALSRLGEAVKEAGLG